MNALSIGLCRCVAIVPVILAAAACGRGFEGGGDLRAQKLVLQREVEGARDVVARLERGEPVLPPEDLAVSIDEALVRDLINAQLPFDIDVNRFHLSLKEADVQFRGSPIVRLRGALNLTARPGLAAGVEVVGALEDIAVDTTSSTLKAKIAVDHIGIKDVTGIGQILSGSSLDEVARLVRLEIKDRLPGLQIPVKVQQNIEFPAVTQGPVRIDGARMPLQVSVSQITAGQGNLWIALHFEPGAFMKTADAPAASDATASDAGVVLGASNDGARTPDPKSKARAK